MTSRAVTVFGGTGFLGRRVVHHLLDRGFDVRVASRHPERVAQAFPNRSSELKPVLADVGNDESVINAVAGGFAVVNAVSLYVERVAPRFAPCTSRLLRELQSIREKQVCSAWPMFPELAPM